MTPQPVEKSGLGQGEAHVTWLSPAGAQALVFRQVRPAHIEQSLGTGTSSSLASAQKGAPLVVTPQTQAMPAVA
jgi:hypothetical protein